MIPYDLLYDSILDFKRAAILVETEIKRHNIAYDSDDPVQGMNGRSHHTMWVSMKAVSHFNLGTSLELMLKLLLVRGRRPAPNHHELAKLYEALSENDRNQLESKYRQSRREFDNSHCSCSIAWTRNLRQRHENIAWLKGFLEYLDHDVMISKKRYSWEQARDGDWRYYLDDITVFVELIDKVMNDIPRT